jgi:hypothetical protein
MSSRERTERRRRVRRRRLAAEALEDRRLLAVSFEFNYLGGNAVGFNHPTEGDSFRAALESAAGRLGGWLLDDATVQMDVASQEFDGSAVAIATSELSGVSGGGFFHNVIPGKIVGQGDANGAAADGRLDVFFFAASDPFTFVTDPAQAGGDDEIDFQAVIIHELVHSIGFTSTTTANGSDLAGNGITTPGTWTPYDQFLSDVDGNRLIDSDPASMTAFRMDTSPSGWPLHSVGGKGPDAGMFFAGPIAKAVYGGPVPLYSPSTFYSASSVTHLDSEGYPSESFVFSPLTHLMSHTIVDLAVPQELTLLEKAMLADIGIRMSEDVAPIVIAPNDIIVEANSEGGFTGRNQQIDDFLDAVAAEDLFDSNPIITHDLPAFLPLGPNMITFMATDESGNVGLATAFLAVVDTTAPMISVTPPSVTFEATGPDGVSGVTLPFVATVTDVVDPNPVVVFNPGSDFPLGTTTATYTARDSALNIQTFEVDIIVRDTIAPDFSLPDTLTIDSNLADGADLSNAELIDFVLAGASDLVDPSLTIAAEPLHFPFGTTAVTFTLTDDSGNAATATAELTVLDTRFAVTTLDDELDPDPASDPSDLSLREAISLSNGRDGADFIHFDPSLAGSVLLDASLGPLQISDSVTLLGPGQQIISVDGQDSSRVFDLTDTAGDVTISRLTISGGRLSGDNETGAGVRSASPGTLTIEQTTISGNVTTGAGGIGAGIHQPAGPLVLSETVISGNATEGDSSPGGGVWAGGSQVTVLRTSFVGNSTSSADSSGGGLFLSQSATTIVDSTFAGNSTAGNGSTGGGIHALLSSVELVNSTISGNTTGSGADGGGIFADQGDLDVDNSTITANQAGGAGGGIGVNAGVPRLSLTIHHSIVAANSDAGTAPDFDGSGVLATAASVEFSLVGDNTGTTLAESQSADPATGNIVGDPGGAGTVDPKLGPLTDNGGATHTHFLLEGSPAINAGDPGFDAALFSPPLVHDQRGDSRVSGRQIDIGSVEIAGVIDITWPKPGDIVFGTELGAEQLNAVSSVQGVFEYNPPPGTILNAGQAQMLRATFTPSDLLAYSPSTATAFIDVIKADPVITWPRPDSIVFGTALGNTELNATSSVSGSFEYSPPAGAILNAGEDRVLSVTFTPIDATNFNSVTSSTLMDVELATPIVTWENPADVPFGTFLGPEQLNATANVEGTFLYTPPAGILPNVGLNQTLTVTFTPESPNFVPISQSVSINVLKANPAITWPDPGSIVAGTPLDATQLNASTDLLGTFTYDPPVGAFLDAGAEQTLTATFTPQGQERYHIVSQSVQIDVLAPQDYGDAPSPYPVTLVEDGARHSESTLRLGALNDLDINGTSSAVADADGADDDGVAQIADLIAVAETDTIASFAVDASAAGKLDAWIDFNQDGDWDDAGEQILSSVDVIAGANTLSATIPAGATVGSTAARFRLSSSGGLAPTGDAADGEVEDYLVTIKESSAVTGVGVAALNGAAIVSVESNEIVVRSDQTTLFRAPIANLSQLNVVGGDGHDSVTLDVAGGFTLPIGGLDLRGGLGGNTLAIVGDGGSIDLTAPSLAITQFRHLDLSSSHANTVTFDAATVGVLSPTLGTLSIVAEANDTIVVADLEAWRLTEPVTGGGRFLLTADNSIVGGSESIEADLARPWQNFLRSGDINNDGQVSALDALRIINELGRLAFSDGDTSNLADPLTVGSWPGVYFDHNGDDRVTALDALRVINDLVRQTQVAAVEGEAETVVATQFETNGLDPGEAKRQVDEFATVSNADRQVVVQGDGDVTAPSSLLTHRSETRSQEIDKSSDVIDHLLADKAFVASMLEYSL